MLKIIIKILWITLIFIFILGAIFWVVLQYLDFRWKTSFRNEKPKYRKDENKGKEIRANSYRDLPYDERPNRTKGAYPNSEAGKDGAGPL